MSSASPPIHSSHKQRKLFPLQHAHENVADHRRVHATLCKLYFLPSFSYKPLCVSPLYSSLYNPGSFLQTKCINSAKSGNTAINTSSKIREEKIKEQVEGYIGTSRSLLKNMRAGFFIKRHNHGPVIHNTTWNQNRAADVLGPIMYSQQSFSEIFYGNSLKTLVSLEVSTQPYISIVGL